MRRWIAISTMLCALVTAAAALSAAEARWRPSPGDGFDWQYTQPFNLERTPSTINLDAFDAERGTIQRLRARGVTSICYVNIGAWEDWRPDKHQFPPAILGKNYVGWPGERWLDVRRTDILLPIMRARFQLCRDKGFRAIEVDNLDAFETDTGFRISRAEQVHYNRLIAAEAHAVGLSIAQKNAPGLVPDLVDHYDFLIAEDCFKWNWCGELRPYVAQGKAVVTIEYPEDGRNPLQHCAEAAALGIQIVVKRRKLDSWAQRCR